MTERFEVGQWGSRSLIFTERRCGLGHKVDAENQALVPDAGFPTLTSAVFGRVDDGPRAGSAGSAGGAVGHRKITVVAWESIGLTAHNCRMSKSIPRERACDDLPRGW